MGKTVAVVIIAVAAMFSIPVIIAVYQDANAGEALLDKIGIKPSNGLPGPTIENSIYNLVNEERQNAGLNQVQYSQTLASASHAYAQKMIDDDFFDHRAPDGTTVDSIASDMGYHCLQAPYYAVADNLSLGGAYYGQNTNTAIASHTVSGWMSSEGHRDNILTPSHDEVGVGIAFDDDVAYLVLSFC